VNPSKLRSSAFSNSTLTATETVNHAPTLAITSFSLPTITETAGSRALSAASLLSRAGYADADGKSVPSGIAITSDTGAGTWQWFNGKTWAALPGVSSASALLLPNADSLRFMPLDDLAPNATGSATLTYLAWDQTTGTAGLLHALTNTGGTSAFSSAAATASMFVDFVEQAPTWIAGVGAAFTPAPGISTANPSPAPAGDTVANVFGAAFRDAAGALVSVAISSQTGASVGVWQFSTDNGTQWQSFPTLSTSAALLLSANDKVRFLPKKTFNGDVSLTVYAWDGSGAFSTDVANLTKAGTGGATSFSAATLTATCLVNSAPALT
jgi:hypothetical protein